MGLDEAVNIPLYTLKDGQLYIHSLGTFAPLTVGNAQKRLDQHLFDANFYAKADPERSFSEQSLADLLIELLDTLSHEKSA